MSEFNFKEHILSAEYLGVTCPECKTTKSLFFEEWYDGNPMCMMSCDRCNITLMRRWMRVMYVNIELNVLPVGGTK